MIYNCCRCNYEVGVSLRYVDGFLWDNVNKRMALTKVTSFICGEDYKDLYDRLLIHDDIDSLGAVAGLVFNKPIIERKGSDAYYAYDLEKWSFMSFRDGLKHLQEGTLRLFQNPTWGELEEEAFIPSPWAQQAYRLAFLERTQKV